MDELAVLKSLLTMEEQEQVVPTSEEQTETTEPQVETTEETPEELKERLAKAEELANNYKTRAEKAEAKAKETKPKQDGLSTSDVIFLAKTDIHEDNLDEVIEWAKFKKVPVSEAYKQLKPKLDVEAEIRRTQQATQTKGSPRGTNKVTGEELLAQAQRTGEIPDDAEGMQALFQARLKRQLGVKS